MSQNLPFHDLEFCLSVNQIALYLLQSGKCVACYFDHIIPMLFRDRTEAGKRLAQALQSYADRPDTLVLGLPRGGVPVAFEVAKALKAPLDVFVVRKLGVPRHEEMAMGAIASGGVRVLSQGLVEALNISQAKIDTVTAKEQQELERRERAYRNNRPMPDLSHHTVILVDDGLATGSTMKAAVQALRLQHPHRIVMAVPVASVSVCQEFKQLVDEVVCAETPEPFRAVGLWYDNFSQTTDQEVRQLLQQAYAWYSPSLN